MAEDDDDEGFGDFTFASFPNQINNNNGGGSTRNGSAATATATTADDDEWGDFVEFPPPISQPKLNPKPVVDPFGFFPDQFQSGSNGVELGKKKEESKWVKPRGALPLSLFGDSVEEEESSGPADLDASSVNFAGNLRNESNFSSGVGINDIVANLYSQKPRIKADNGFNLHQSNLNLSLDSNGFNWNQSDLNLNSNSNVRPENGFSNSSQLFSMSSSNLGGLNLGFNELNSSLKTVVDGEDDGWEFKDSYTESKVGNGNDMGHMVSDILEVEVQSLSKIGREMQELPEITMLPSGLSNDRSVDLFPVSNGFPLESHNMEVLFDFKPSTFEQNGLISNTFSQSEQKDKENLLKSDPIVRSTDPDENFGDFEAASPGSGSIEKVQEFPEAAMFSTGLQNGSNGPIDLFSALNDFSSNSYKVDVGDDFEPSTVDKNGSFSYSYSGTDWENGKNRLNLDPVAGNDDSDEKFGEFEAAFPEAGSNQKGNETRTENHKGAVPLSIFGIEEPEAEESLDTQHDFMFERPATFPRNVQKLKSTLSINDILSDLYSQAGSVPSLDSKKKTTKMGLDSADSMLNSNLLDDGDNFDEDSWEFKDAIPQSRAEAQNPHSYHDDSNEKFYTYTEQNDYVDFYCKLKDDLCFVARYHLDNLKKTQSIAANSGEDAKVAAIGEEIQEACDELHQDNIISKEAHSYDQPPREIRFEKYFEVLHELKFHAFESEYHLSRRLSLAESDLRSAVELIKHIKTMLKILTLVPVKEQSDYVHSWSKMLSVCAQELKHGAWIWGQAVEKNVQFQTLCEPQGKRYILALGEIYRVVVILGASVKFYKPWVLSTSVDSTGLYALLEECHTLWSTLGLEEAFQTISDSGPEYEDTIKFLMESIKNIHDLDADGMENPLSIEQENFCRLSVLTPAVVPGLKLVNWNGKNYFVTLANLWANRISSDPSTLPCLHVG